MDLSHAAPVAPGLRVANEPLAQRMDLRAGTEGQMGLTTEVQTAKNYQSVFDVNVKGVLLSMKYEAAAVLRNGGDSIINTSSIGGHIGLAGAGVYVASKHSVNGLSKSAALEFAKKGIRVNTVSPGTIQTEMIARMIGEEESDAKRLWQNQHPVGRFGAAEEVAPAVVWLASPEASHRNRHHRRGWRLPRAIIQPRKML